MDKELEHGWALPLIIDSVIHVKDAGVITLEVADTFSINEKGVQYTKHMSPTNAPYHVHQSCP